MMMSRIALLMAVALLLTACSPKAAPPLAPAPPSTPVAVEPEPPPAPPAPASHAMEPIPEVLARPITAGGPQRVTLQNGDTVSKVGAYFLNVETGSGEAWLYPGQETGWSTSVISADNRFVWETGAGGGYLIDRTAGAVWQWDDKRVRPLLMSDRGFLFAELEEKDRNLRDTGRYFWTGPDFKPLQVFPLDGEQQTASGALLSPDGQRLAFLLQGRNPLIALLDLGSDIQQMLVVPGADSWIGSVSLSATSDGFAVAVWVSEGNPTTAMPRWHELIRRYDWQGRVQRDLQIPGHYAFFSPDGRWVAWQESALLGGLAPVTIVAEAATLRPELTVLGASPCFAVAGSMGNRWLADSSGLVLATTTNQYRLLTLDGSLQEPPGFAGRSWQGEPQPAPDKADRIAFGRLAVLDGKRQLGVKLDGFVTPRGDDAWGRTSRELRFTLPPPARGSACYELPAMDSLVLKAGEPVPEFPLIVRSSACVPLQGTGPASLHDVTAHSRRREILERALTAIAADGTALLPEHAVAVSADCTLCPVCSKLCPSGALRRTESGDRLTWHAAACTGCGLCRATCPVGAVADEERLSVGRFLAPEAEVLVTGEKAVCACGQTYWRVPGGQERCVACRMRSGGWE